MNPIKKATELVGSQAALASLLGVTPGAVSQWVTSGAPVNRCIDIEKATDGRVRCEELRPDIDWAYLRATDCPVKEAA